MPQFHRKLLLAVLLLPFLAGFSGGALRVAPVEPQAPAELGAPWPAGIVLVAGGSGYGYGPTPKDTTHAGRDNYAMDFNGYADKENPPTFTKEDDLLVLAEADGCIKEIKYHAGYLKNGEWKGNYGWSVVINHANGYQSRYAHLKETPLVPLMSYDPAAAGDPKKCYFVTQGQPIGQNGGTGTNATNSVVHLHFVLYLCDKPGSQCSPASLKPEPLEGISDLPSGLNVSSVKVTSKNFGVGYEKIEKQALTNPAALVLHKPIRAEYLRLGGQNGLFGRSSGYVTPLVNTDYFYQAFAPHALQSSFAMVILEVNGKAYGMPRPIWEAYSHDPVRYGPPAAPAYISQMGNAEAGWRMDFQNASIFWSWTMPVAVVWDAANAPWRAQFCPGTNSFGCNPVRRRDAVIDFSFGDASNPGPLQNVQGFSALWEAGLEQNLVSQISLEYEVQGHVRFYIDDKVQGDWIRSEDAVLTGVTKPTWHVRGNTFSIRFWQSPGKPARLKLKVHEAGLALVPSAFAAESQGTLASSVYQPPAVEYINYEPPLCPEQAGPEEIPLVEEEPGQPTETPGDSPLPSLPPFDPAEISQWWNEMIQNLQDRLSQWWQEKTQNAQDDFDQWLQDRINDLEKWLEVELQRMLAEALDSLARQCSGGFILAIAAAGGVAIRKRVHPK
jgi:hypothetical protein